MNARVEPDFGRRQFLKGLAGAAGASGAAFRALGESGAADVDVDDRVRGLLWGAAIGDALGGPIEFQSRENVQTLPDPPRAWVRGEKADAAACRAAARRLRLRPYDPLRPGTESYGQWNPHSVPGTITDDTRHKLVLLQALHRTEQRQAWPLGVKDLAQAYLDWPGTAAVVGRPGYEALAADWLEEWQWAARWVLGERDLNRALPPERMWQALPTCCGQMTLLPLAALFPGRPREAYVAAYHLGFFDNGFGKDLNAALVAGLAQALVTPSQPDRPRAAFDAVLRVMRETDPLRFRSIRWSERAVDRWLNLARQRVAESEGEPARLFESLERDFATTTKWEAQVPVVVTFACLELVQYDPLAGLQLSVEWGHDTDSYASLVGAFSGALFGATVFDATLRGPVADRLKADHGVDLQAESEFLIRLGRDSKHRALIAVP